jgi:hypothetical protein
MNIQDSYDLLKNPLSTSNNLIFEFDYPEDSNLANFRIISNNYVGLFNSEYLISNQSDEIIIRFKNKSNHKTFSGYQNYKHSNSNYHNYTEMRLDDFLLFLKIGEPIIE